MKKPCENCPFLREGAISLARGRLEDICSTLLASDHESFLCHKTVHSKIGGEWDDDGKYVHSGKESHCVGAMVYLHKMRMPSVPMRVAHAMGLLSVEQLDALAPLVIDDVLEAKCDPD